MAQLLLLFHKAFQVPLKARGTAGMEIAVRRDWNQTILLE